MAVNPMYNYTVKVLRDISHITYTDLQSWALPYVSKGEGMQHSAFLALAERGYIEYERKTIK